jgi:hypothetical protein
MVTSFFDSVDNMDDETLYNFIEALKGDIELIMGILHSSPNEMIVFFTYLLVLLKKLEPTASSFLNAVHMIKNLVNEINDDKQTPVGYANDFNRFFNNHLLKNYCTVILESPQKRA